MAAGASVNLVVAAISLALLLLVTASMVPKAQGTYISSMDQNYPAYRAGIRPGDFLVRIDNSPFTDLHAYKPGQAVNATVVRNGNTISFNNIALAKCQVTNLSTNQTVTYACLGVTGALTYSDAKQLVSNFASPSRGFYAYLCIPTLPRCSGLIPFSDVNIGAYTFPLGEAALPILTSLFFWLWFVNFFLGIINSLPIYPLDGGQAFEVAVKALGRGRVTEVGARRITIGTTVVVLSIYLAAAFGPYLAR
jgi:membrane-associated protease RseP (regulator of RpoE activity)